MHIDIQTNPSNFRDKDSFLLLYHPVIRDTFRSFCKCQDLAEELTQEFVLRKILPDNGLISKYERFVERTVRSSKKRPQFRRYLVRSVQREWINHLRLTKACVTSQDSFLLQLPDRAYSQERLDPDAIYAYVVLYRVLNIVRSHCRDTEKEHIWSIYEELVLGPFDESRHVSTRLELREKYFPGEDSNRKIENAIITIKRMIQRCLEKVLRNPLGEYSDELSVESWADDLRDSNSRVHRALEAAVMLRTEVPTVQGTASVLPLFELDEGIDHNVLCFALNLRLHLPLIEWTEWPSIRELRALFPVDSPLIPYTSRTNLRPLSLAMLMSPSIAERREIDRINAIQILTCVKDLAKSLYQCTAVPHDRQVFRRVYAIAITIARLEFRQKISSLSVQDHQHMLWQIQLKSWLDDPTRDWIVAALQRPGVWHDIE